MFKFISVFLLSLITSFSAWAESFVAKVDHNPISYGETFTLTLQYDGAPGRSEPDLSPLNKDFVVHSVGRSSQYRNINGVSSHLYQWNVVLSPKTDNQLTIPAISFKSYSSQPIKLKIAKDEDAGNSVPKFSIGRSINNNKPLVQEQILYTLIIKTTESIHGDLPQFVDSGNNEWIIKQLGAPTVSSEIDNGTEAQTISINYALFPQKSGHLKTPELQFNGYYIDKDKARNRSYSNVFSAFFDDNFASGFGVNPAVTRINLTAQPLDVDVQPIPSANNGNWWLPSTDVKISSDWDDKIPEFKVGEAASRKIRVTAVGVAENQLPKLSFPETPELKQYPETPEYKSSVVNDDIVSEMTLNVVYIPQQGGKITIPSLTIPWYNTATETTEKAVLPSIAVHASGTAPVIPELKSKTDIKTPTTPISEPSSDSKGLSLKFVWGIVALAFALGLLVSWLILHFMHAEKRLNQHASASSDIDDILRSDNLKDIRNIVISWARELFPEHKIINLDDVSSVFSSEDLSSQLQKLGAALYAGRNDGFDKTALHKTMKKISKKTASAQKQKPLLPDLYK